MTKDKKDDGVLPGEQLAFCEAFDLSNRILEREKLPIADVGMGLLVAAIATFRKALTDEEISKIMYEFADDFATRQLKQD